MTAVALTKAWPLLSADDPTVGINTDRDFRMLLAGLLLPDPVTGDPMAVRPGVIPHQWDDQNSVTSLRVQAQATASRKVDVLGGPFICFRSGQGPYYGWSESTVEVDIPASDIENDRVDIVYSRVGDMLNFAGIDDVHGPYADVWPGTPANPAEPDFAGLPEGAVPLATVDVAANSDVVEDADITLIRKGTTLNGGVRRLLEGDSPTDPGRVDGEKRYRQAAGILPALEDYWDAKEKRWRGNQSILLTADFPGTTGHTSGTGRLTIITFNVPDPGWPYRVKTSGVLRISGGICNVFVSVNNSLFSSAIATLEAGDPSQPFYLVPGDSGLINGPSVVRLNIDPLSTNVVTWKTDSRNKLLIEVQPQ